MVEYNLFTENKNLSEIESIVNFYFIGYTIIKAIGYYKGIKEKSIIIKILGDKKDIQKINLIIKSIKILNRQESILLTIRKLEAQFLW